MKTIETLDPKAFRGLITTIGELPSSFVDSMSYYEMIAWLVDYIKNNVIPAVNNNAEAIKEIQKWIETLDLQDEVDNKLDEMAASGQLAEIISQYLNSTAIFGYNTVADMQSAENFVDGSFARTMGYYAKNDGGGALYKIRSITNDDTVDDATIIEITADPSNNLVAELIFDNVNLAQFGAKGDGVTDDTSAIKHAFDIAYSQNRKVVAGEHKSYLVSESINIKNTHFDMNGSTFKTTSALDSVISINIEDNTNFTDYGGVLENGHIDCSNAVAGLKITMGRKKLIKNMFFDNISNYGLHYAGGYEVIVKDSHFTAVGNASSGASATSVGIYAQSGDAQFIDNVLINCATAILNRGFNFYRGIHAWIRTHSLAPDAIMFKCGGNIPAIIEQCYSDTYGITFDMEDAYVIVNQLYVYFNGTIYESLIAPTLFKSEAQYTDYYKRQTSLTNSVLRGVNSTTKLAFSNENSKNIKVNYNNTTNVTGYPPFIITNSLTDQAGTTNVVSVDTSRITVRNGFVNLNLVFSINTTISKSFILGNLPNYAVPSGSVKYMCMWGDNNINGADGIGTLDIYDTKVRGTLYNVGGSVTKAYVKINVTYPIASEFTGA